MHLNSFACRYYHIYPCTYVYPNWAPTHLRPLDNTPLPYQLHNLGAYCMHCFVVVYKLSTLPLITYTPTHSLTHSAVTQQHFTHSKHPSASLTHSPPLARRPSQTFSHCTPRTLFFIHLSAAAKTRLYSLQALCAQLPDCLQL